MNTNARVIFYPGRVWLQTIAGDGTEILLGEIIYPPMPGSSDDWIVLRKVSYVGNTGRHSEFVKGILDENSEIEVYPEDLEVNVQVRHVIRANRWPTELPTVTR